MKLFIVSLLMVFVVAFSLSITQAKPAQVTFANAFFADQIPAGADLYMAIRTDDAYIDELDGLLKPIFDRLSDLGAYIPFNEGIRPILDTLVRSTTRGTFEATVRPWLGSSMAFAVYLSEPRIFVAIDHSNRELAEAVIENIAQGELNVSVEGDFNIYSQPNTLGTLTINHDAIYITAGATSTPFTGVTGDVLSNDRNFQKAVGALSAPSYNILLTGDTATLIQLLDSNRNITGDFIRSVAPDAYTAIGATIFGGVSPTIDLAQVGLPEAIISLINTPINPVFAQHIPANATAVIHGTNLLAPYNGLIDWVSAQTRQDLRGQLSQAQELFGFDVTELLFSGDFAIYFTYKPEGIVAMMNQQLEALETNPYGFTPFNVESILDMGILFEVSNVNQAQLLIDQLANLYNMLGANSNIAISRELIAGRNALILTVNSLGIDSFDIIVGTNDTVFTIGTRQSSIAILNGEAGFNSNPFYQNSLRYTLPTMTHYWFVNRNIISSMGGFFGILTPQVSMAFTSINDTLVTPNPTDVALREERLRERSRQAILLAMTFNESAQSMAQLFDNATVSVSSKEGILFVRAVVTMNK